MLTQGPESRRDRTAPGKVSPADEGSAANADVPLSEPGPRSEVVVRVMGYLTEEEAQTLDDVWLRLRQHPSRPSKSDILRAALMLAATDLDTLTAALSRQRTSTLSRQRRNKRA